MMKNMGELSKVQFIRGGPHVPERFLQAHEEGRVVFFCGAGISYPAGLPNFECLAKKLFNNLRGDLDDAQKKAMDERRYDKAIGLLEENVVGGREGVRKEMASILEPDLRDKSAIMTHESLLVLSKTHKENTRLVTTNYDRIFEEIINKKSLSIERYKAPFLPNPKKSRWNGLVYLHGLLEKSPTQRDLNRLVISSGDFGLAYLVERWAARFLSELLRNYTICFIGYSIDDPVIGYMMDAIAVDLLLGETHIEQFAFVGYSKGKKTELESKWREKKVTPILYLEDDDHIYLHETLHKWADIYRDGSRVRGKKQIVDEIAIRCPLSSTPEDDFVGRMLWVLSDPSGLPAERFAEFNPSPSLEWLNVLSEDRYLEVDLRRFGVFPNPNPDKGTAFSMIRRPHPCHLAPLMGIVDDGAQRSGWDNIMWHLGHWLTNHLDNPKLLLWLARRGGQLHDNFVRLIKDHIDKSIEFSPDDRIQKQRLSSDGKPKKTLSPAMRNLWGLMLAGRVRHRENITGVERNYMYHWCNQFKRDGLTFEMRMKLRENLTPHVLLHE
ncbi:MAG: SIR2 family protein [Ectothiorhodospiraceae bacterium AqS1]|nr:SIR2 family protein [Ectothiorhodospiraceae bacterium AqS1]